MKYFKVYSNLNQSTEVYPANSLDELMESFKKNYSKKEIKNFKIDEMTYLPSVECVIDMDDFTEDENDWKIYVVNDGEVLFGEDKYYPFMELEECWFQMLCAEDVQLLWNTCKITVDQDDITDNTSLINEITDFFNGLIEKTNDYFLSDYVEQVREYLDAKEADKIIAKRDKYKAVCERYGVNLHQISCDVAQKHLEKEGIIKDSL